ncbi:predicted protein [Chaetoceros tenuissimus]|uniref:Uncharacterized protein n=1 Tax=Chaetoceros tenuissimus TaxID=426638 RepID=A0AAD3DBN7_9STRA|nr:predicted protein [Chaetoceros tenuissimus]
MKKIRLSEEDWDEAVALGPGVREYKGMRTLFYNGEKLWRRSGNSRFGSDHLGRPRMYRKQERRSWQAIIVLPGVKIIPAYTFFDCESIEVVIMADTGVLLIREQPCFRRL